MLSKTRSVKKLVTRLALFVPVLALCFYFFNEEIVAKPVVQKESASILGKWVDRERDFSEFTIYKEGKQLWMKFAKDTFYLQQQGKNQYAMIWKNKPFAAHKEISLNYKPEYNELLLEDKSFIRPENSYRELFAGDWEGVEIDQRFEIRSGYGATSWTVKDQFGTNTFHPALYADGFYFNLNNRKVQFSLDETGNRIISSIGHTYKKVQEAPKVITLYVVDNRVSLISQSSSKDKLAEDLNAMTANWSSENYRNYKLNVISQEGMDQFLEELNTEFKKTKLYQTNSSRDLLTQPETKEAIKPLQVENKKIALHLKVLKDDSLLLNGYQLTDLSNLESALEEFYNSYSPEERRENIIALIDSDAVIKLKTLERVKQQLNQYGIEQISVNEPNIPKPEAAPIKSNKTLNKPVTEESEIIQVFEDIYIEVDKNHQVYINSEKIDSDRIEKALSRYNSDYTKAERAKVMDVKITVDPSVKMGLITDVKSALRDYGVKSIKVITAGEPQEEALIPAESDTKKQITNRPYELEIRISKNDEIQINGKQTTLNQFSQDISEVRETLIQQETSNKIFVFIFPSPRTPDHLITYIKKELNKQNLKSLAVIHMEMPPLPKNATKEEKKQHRLACYQIYVNYMKEKYGDDVKLQPISEYPWSIKSSQ